LLSWSMNHFHGEILCPERVVASDPLEWLQINRVSH
jgi:hypothetical protein